MGRVMEYLPLRVVSAFSDTGNGEGDGDGDAERPREPGQRLRAELIAEGYETAASFPRRLACHVCGARAVWVTVWRPTDRNVSGRVTTHECQACGDAGREGGTS